MNFTGVPSGLTGIGKPGIEAIHLRMVRLFTQKSRATSSAVISSGRLFIFITSSKKERRLEIWRKTTAAERKNRPREKPYVIILFPLSYVCKHGFIVEYDVFVIGRDDLHNHHNGEIILVR